MQWANIISQNKTIAPSSLQHLHTQTALSSLENSLSKWLLIGGIVAVGLVLAPVILPYLGIGGGVAAALSEECCKIVGTNTGIAGSLSALIESIPVVGTYLSTEGGKNILVPAITILGGQAAGSLVSHFEHAAGKKGVIGGAIRVSSLGLGVVLAMPAVLPGIGHGVQFLSRLAGAEGFGATIAKFLGNTSTCTSVATTNGIMGGVSTLAAHLPCAIPAVTASFPLLVPAISKNANGLPANDPNYFLTPEQQSWVEAYNGAAKPQKIILQEMFHEKGFDPDFHADGTMHLYKHAAGMAR
jgi:hypothetical protein